MRHTLAGGLVERLAGLREQSGTTQFMTLLSGFALLLYRLGGQSDLVFGSPIANRTRQAIEGLVGFFANTLVLRVQVGPDEPVRKVLGHVREVALEAYAHQDVPFEKLVEELQPERDLSHTPLVQVLFQVFTPPTDRLQLPGLDIQFVDTALNTAKFDLEVRVSEAPDVLQLVINYNADLYEQATIARLARQYQTLLEQIVAEPDQPVACLSLLTAAERRQVLEQWNVSHMPAPKWAGLQAMFKAQVARTPDAPAVAVEGSSLTYRELNERANALAAYLQALGAGPEARVGVYVARSIEMIVGVLGILKAGAGYIPLDPIYPPDRLGYMLEDAGIMILLTQQALAGSLPFQGQEICLDTGWPLIEQYAQSPLSHTAGPEHLAYVIYTSGSTGRPKGVQIEHRQIVHYVQGVIERLQLDAYAQYALVSTFGADLGNTVLFPALCTGGCLHIISEERAADPEALARYFTQHRIDCVKIVPSHFAALLTVQDPARVVPRCLILGGEASQWQLIERIHALNPECRVFNHYGPTETTVGVLTYPVARDQSSRAGETVPLGRPLGNTQVYVLDSRMQPVPIGAPGELYIGGAGVARGYLGRPDLTAERFIPNPFAVTTDDRRPTTDPRDKVTRRQGDKVTDSSEEITVSPPHPVTVSGKSVVSGQWSGVGGRLYKTGDLVRWRAEGILEFLGRSDDQVKIRGFRIELNEIETILREHPHIAETVVVAREDRPGDHRLVAYLVARGDLPLAELELRDLLVKKLPVYMVPSAFVFLDRLPRLPNGKINRTALPKPDSARPDLLTAYSMPTTALEKAIAGVWQEVLGIDSVGIYDNFFDLGGHSLLMIVMQNKLRERFDRTVSLTTMFNNSTIRDLARYIGADQEAPITLVAQHERARTRRELLAQNRETRNQQRGAYRLRGERND